MVSCLTCIKCIVLTQNCKKSYLDGVWLRAVAGAVDTGVIQVCICLGNMQLVESRHLVLTEVHLLSRDGEVLC